MSDKKKGNIVMKTKSIITLAAMALMMAACTSEDLTQPQTPSSKGIPFTATISGKAATRAIKENTTDGILETSWAKEEKVALIYTGSNSNTVVDTMEVTEVGTDGSATISGTITGSPADGTEVRLIYPASAVDKSGEVKADLLNVQDGTLAFIAEKLDVRLSDGANPAKLKVVLGSATIDGAVSLKNQLAIVKFSLSDGSDVLATECFEIQDGTDQTMITVEPSPAASEFYVAMYPATAQAFQFIAKKGDEEYFYSQPSATLSAGYYYQSSVELHPKIKYIEASWNSTDHKVDLNEKTLSDASQYTLVTSSTTDVTWPAGTYVVSSDASISGVITLTGDVNLILCDGAELTVNGKIDGGTISLNIYGQTAGTGKLTIDGGGSPHIDIRVQNLQIHGGDITGTNCDRAIVTNGTFKIYHGSVNAKAQSNGLYTSSDLSIYGGSITADSNSSSIVGFAVYVENGAMEMTGGSLMATATGVNHYGISVKEDINISGGTVNATGGSCAYDNGGTGIECKNGDITISGTANVTATGGNSGGGGNGGHGIIASGNEKKITISGGTVNATGGVGGGDGYGGHAIITSGLSSRINITGGHVTATATGTNGDGINSPTIDYYGGQVEASGADRAIYGTLTNLSGGIVSIKTKQNGGEADWTSSDIGPYNYSGPSTLTFRCIKINM